jgi:hypothetical protein
MNNENTLIMTKNEINEYYEEFKYHYMQNPSIIIKIKELLSFLDKNLTYPFYLLDVKERLFPKLVGENGSKFLIHILREGLPKEVQLDDDQLFIELKTLIMQYGIPFVCAERFLDNPMDYATLQHITRSDSDKSFLRIIRSDKKSFELYLDLPTMFLFTEHLIDKMINTIRTNQEELPEQLVSKLMDKFLEFLEISGVLNERDTEYRNME